MFGAGVPICSKGAQAHRLAADDLQWWQVWRRPGAGWAGLRTGRCVRLWVLKAV